MNPHKDYYSILGVIQSAEDAVIRAAYRALAQKYHPDKNVNSAEEYSKKFVEIQEAYEVLSDKEKRKAYDASRPEFNFGKEGFFDESAEFSSNSPDDSVNYDWIVASKYYPELIEISNKLSQISSKLSYSFKAYILREKLFKRCREIADNYERAFLEQFFGKNDKIISFARHLISLKCTLAIKELNETIRVLGEDSDPEQIIRKISKDHKLSQAISTHHQELIQCVKSGDWAGVRKILEAGVRTPEIRDEQGQTLIELARQKYDIPMIELLRAYGYY